MAVAYDFAGCGARCCSLRGQALRSAVDSRTTLLTCSCGVLSDELACIGLEFDYQRRNSCPSLSGRESWSDSKPHYSFA